MAKKDDKSDDKTKEDADLISGEEIQATVVDDGLDLDIVDEFKEDDFDEDFDDDFEEEIEGEYDLLDDKYGKEFDENFGHITDPTRVKKKAPVKPDDAGDDPKADKDAEKKKATKSTKKTAAAKVIKKKAARKK